MDASNHNTSAEIFEDFGPSYDNASNPKLQGKPGFDMASKAIGYLERRCPKLVQTAQEAGDWDYICKKQYPTLAAEQFAIHQVLKETDAVEKYGTMDNAIYSTLRRVKRHLIHRNMTVLEANERSMLGTIIEFCAKQDAVKPLKAHMTDRVFAADTEDESKVG